MAIIATRQTPAAAARMPGHARPRALSFLASRLTAGLERYACWRKRRATERALAAMPQGMRKDFGWPAPGRPDGCP